MTPQHNIPLMRRVLAQITCHPALFDFADFTRDLSGWAVKLSGTGWAHLDPDAGHEAVEMIDYATGRTADIAEVTAELLGTTPEETEHLMYSSRHTVIDWLVDAINQHEHRVIARMERDFAEEATR